jgi:TRAP-type mannitol/chloroaromatic compound transport system permease small subunit
MEILLSSKSMVLVELECNCTSRVYDDGVIYIFSSLHLQGNNCELKVKNGMVYDGVFKTYSPEVRTITKQCQSKVFFLLGDNKYILIVMARAVLYDLIPCSLVGRAWCM